MQSSLNCDTDHTFILSRPIAIAPIRCLLNFQGVSESKLCICVLDVCLFEQPALALWYTIVILSAHWILWSWRKMLCETYIPLVCLTVIFSLVYISGYTRLDWFPVPDTQRVSDVFVRHTLLLHSPNQPLTHALTVSVDPQRCRWRAVRRLCIESKIKWMHQHPFPDRRCPEAWGKSSLQICSRLDRLLVLSNIIEADVRGHCFSVVVAASMHDGDDKRDTAVLQSGYAVQQRKWRFLRKWPPA